MTLGKLRKGDKAVIVAIHARHQSLREKLTSRGLVPGTQLALLSHGNPLMVAVDQSRWAITQHDAEHIEVALLQEAGRRRGWFGRGRKRATLETC